MKPKWWWLDDCQIYFLTTFIRLDRENKNVVTGIKNHINGVLLLLLPSNTIRNNITGSQNAEDDVLFFGVEPKNLHSRQKSLEVLTVVLGSAFAMASLFHGVFIHRNIIINMQNNIFFLFCFRSKEKVTLFKQKKKQIWSETINCRLIFHRHKILPSL
jgi:hypothetical protein